MSYAELAYNAGTHGTKVQYIFELAKYFSKKIFLFLQRGLSALIYSVLRQSHTTPFHFQTLFSDKHRQMPTNADSPDYQSITRYTFAPDNFFFIKKSKNKLYEKFSKEKAIFRDGCHDFGCRKRISAG